MPDTEQAELEAAIGPYVQEAIRGLLSGLMQDKIAEAFTEKGFPERNATNVVDLALLIAQHAVDLDEGTDSTQSAENLKNYAESAGFSPGFCQSMIEFTVNGLAAIPTGDDEDADMAEFLSEAGIEPETAQQMVELARIVLAEKASRDELVAGLVEADVMPEDDAGDFVDGVILADGFAKQLREDVSFETLAPELVKHAPWITYIACQLAR
jgi:hypothetical protein